jgi:exodeoxyribonuclease III
MKTHIVSWNVNGVRAALDKGLLDSMQEWDADFVCLQETKASPDQVEHPLLQHGVRWNSVWASAEKKGYSGVATFTPHRTCKMTASLNLPLYDREGRGNIIFAKNFTLVNLYFPNGAASDERHNFKMKFLDEILLFFKELEQKHGPLIIVGDYNIAHREIDIHDPAGNKDSSGFRPEERAWMDKFFAAGFVDAFRHVHGDKKDEYSWWSYRQRSRERNKGWRIDYISVSQELAPKIKSATIHQNVLGSDHCPIDIVLSI